MVEGKISYIDHNEFIDIRVSVLVEPAVGERHFLFPPLYLSLPLIDGLETIRAKSAG